METRLPYQDRVLEVLLRDYNKVIKHIDKLHNEDDYKNGRSIAKERADLSKERADFSFAYLKQVIGIGNPNPKYQKLNELFGQYSNEITRYDSGVLTSSEFLNYLITFFTKLFNYIDEDYKKTGNVPILSDTNWATGKKRKTRNKRRRNI
jgi:hypothetical protein